MKLTSIIMILLNCKVDTPTMHPLFEKMLVAFLGIMSALVTDYFIKRLRQKKKNIRDGKYSLEEAYNNKLSGTNFKEKSIYILPPLTDFDQYLIAKGKNATIIRKKLNSPYPNLYKAEDELKYIKEIFDN